MNMKELSIEEKAKRYDELKVTAQELEHDGCFDKITLFDLFPELKESEDEESKKWILEYLYDGLRMSDEQFKGQFKSAIAWLEKQGEYKPTDKTEPKFKNGQWIVWQDKCYKVNDNGCGYELVDQNGLSTSLEYETIDKNAHLLTIQDAKEESKKIEHKHFCELDNSYTCVKFPFKAKVKSSDTIVTIHGGQLSLDGKEWIKYQSDAEDGYEVYEPNNLELVCEIKQNPTWSEEDERKIGDIRDAITLDDELEESYKEELYDFLKSLKERYTWKPSDEQINALDNARHSNPFNVHILDTLFHDLNKLK